jgi:hypothetical protein
VGDGGNFKKTTVTTRLVVIFWITWLTGTRLNDVWVRGWIRTIMLRLDHCW